MASPPDSLCVVRLSAIGDCCHTLPVLRTLQAVWPATRLTWIIGRTEHALLQDTDGIEFVTYDKAAPWASLACIRRTLAGREFPILLHMHASMRANWVTAMVRARRRIGFDRRRARDSQWWFSTERIPARPEQHVIDGLFGFLEYLGIRERVMRWDIPVSDDDRAFAAAQIAGYRPTVVISPCSSQRFRNYRNWRVERYVELARRLQAGFGARVILTGGRTEVEQEYGHEIAAGAPGSINLVGGTTLKQLYALIREVQLVICPDSGPAHLATAAGTPVVGLYATSNRYRTGPYLSQALVVDRYPEAVQREFGVPPSELRWGQRVRDPAAMDLISVDDVVASCARVLGK
jgi:heptosyltransferase I